MKSLQSLGIVLLIWLICPAAGAEQMIRIGSKNFNESYVLSEIIAQLLESNGFTIARNFGLGGTLICYEALRNGEIDLYVEYTGTLSQAILNLGDQPDHKRLNEHLAARGMRLLEPFGFNNAYAIAVRSAVAEQHGLRSIGDLSEVAGFELVFSHEFLEREDGWPGLSRVYNLVGDVRGIEHGLAYQALNEGAIDVTDVYSTDGELVRYSLQILEDDLGYFPDYVAAPLVRSDFPQRARAVLAGLSDTIDDRKMQLLNADVVFGGQSFARVASAFLADQGVRTDTSEHSRWRDLAYNTLRHLQLTGIALGLAIAVGLGVSLLVYRSDAISAGLIYFCGLLQTIPSIALLALMIPVFGIGMTPAIIALFLYSLLPILRNAVTALTHVDKSLVQISLALGMTSTEQLRFVLLPLSLPAIFAGIRTAAVISIGTATLAAFIGAGGLGDPIVVGLSLGDVGMILQGAIPAALLAVVTELLFEVLERWFERRR